MGALQGRVAIITGAGRGQGRQHALLFAKEGAKVVVNDSGVQLDGSRPDPTVAQAVVDEIRSAGGEAVANADDVAGFEAGERLVQLALERFGDLHVVVNNAGILRFSALPDLTEQDWDMVVGSHAKGAFNLMRWASRYWRDQARSGPTPRASIINLSSNVATDVPDLDIMTRTDKRAVLIRQTALEEINYGAAKAAMTQMTLLAASALAPYGIRVNAVQPQANTRMAEPFGEVRAPEDPALQHRAHPANSSPIVAWLASERCRATQMVFKVSDPHNVRVLEPWTMHEVAARDFEAVGRWTIAELDAQLTPLVETRLLGAAQPVPV